jgi:hypothetical protein
LLTAAAATVGDWFAKREPRPSVVYQREVGRGLGNPRGEFSEVYEGSAWETLRARQGFLGSVRDFALFGLVLMLHPLHLLGK